MMELCKYKKKSVLEVLRTYEQRRSTVVVSIGGVCLHEPNDMQNLWLELLRKLDSHFTFIISKTFYIHDIIVILIFKTMCTASEECCI